jgi:hypothetical protein
MVGNALKARDVSGHKKPAIVKADRDPAIVAALDNLAYLTLQCHLGFPCETLSDQSNPIANFEISFRFRVLLHLLLPSARCRQMQIVRAAFSRPVGADGRLFL